MKKMLLIISIFISILSANGDLHLFEIDNTKGNISPQSIESEFVKNGFGISVNSDMINPFMIQFKETKFKVFTLMTVFDEKISFELVKKYPDAGIFTPLGVGIYQNKEDNTLHVSVLTADAYKKILNIDDPLIHELNEKVLQTLKKALPNATHKVSKKALKENNALITKYELPIDGRDIQGAKESLFLTLNNGLSMYGFVVPGKLDLNKHISNTPYDFYEGYSICKLPVIYTVALTNPEASAFAPCTLAIYKKKDENKIVMEFPSVYNWISSAIVNDKTGIDVLLKAQEQFEAILAEILE